MIRRPAHQCLDCHDEKPYTDNPDGDDVPYDLRGGELPRPMLLKSLDRVAFGMMPKNQALDEHARDAPRVPLLAQLREPAPAR